MMKRFFYSVRCNRLVNLLVVNLRYLIGIGFLPSGMTKVLDHPFTDPRNSGVFAEFLHAFYATGFYYNIVGVMQVLAAVLLITQRFATLGAFLFLPIIFNITVLTLSTIGSLTPIVALLMFLGNLFLLFWDAPKWINIISKDNINPVRTQRLPTYNRIQFYTGVFLVLVPSGLFALSFPGAGALAIVAILLIGNLLSEWHFPVLRRLWRNK